MYTKIIETVSNSISKELDFDEEKKEIIAYSLEYCFLQIFGFIPIIILGYLFGVLKATLIASIFGAILRKFSGGAHFNSPLLCLLFGASIYTIIGKVSVEIGQIPNFNSNILFILLFIALITVYRFSPVDSPAKPIHSEDFKKRLKCLSVAFIIITIILLYFIDSLTFRISASLGILYQTLTLLPLFNKRR